MLTAWTQFACVDRGRCWQALSVRGWRVWCQGVVNRRLTQRGEALGGLVSAGGRGKNKRRRRWQKTGTPSIWYERSYWLSCRQQQRTRAGDISVCERRSWKNVMFFSGFRSTFCMRAELLFNGDWVKQGFQALKYSRVDNPGKSIGGPPVGNGGHRWAIDGDRWATDGPSVGYGGPPEGRRWKVPKGWLP